MRRALLALALAPLLAGCATMKQSDTARTGIEQLLISSAADRALDSIDFKPIAGSKVFIDEKYLDCVDKNYVLLSTRQRLLRLNCSLQAKAEDADVVVEMASGGVGTDRTDMFVGIPSVPLPPPSPVSLPKLTVFERVRAMGTAKLVVVAYDAKTRLPVINADYAIARADHRNWTVLGFGGVNSGSVHDELVSQAGDNESITGVSKEVIGRRRGAGSTGVSLASRMHRLPPVAAN